MAGTNGHRFSLLALLLSPREAPEVEHARQQMQQVPVRLRELREALERGELCPGDLLDSEDEEVSLSPRPETSERTA